MHYEPADPKVLSQRTSLKSFGSQRNLNQFSTTEDCATSSKKGQLMVTVGLSLPDQSQESKKRLSDMSLLEYRTKTWQKLWVLTVLVSRALYLCQGRLSSARTTNRQKNTSSLTATHLETVTDVTAKWTTALLNSSNFNYSVKYACGFIKCKYFYKTYFTGRRNASL